MLHWEDLGQRQGFRRVEPGNGKTQVGHAHHRAPGEASNVQCFGT
jgi:hypothetical protein